MDNVRRDFTYPRLIRRCPQEKSDQNRHVDDGPKNKNRPSTYNLDDEAEAGRRDCVEDAVTDEHPTDNVNSISTGDKAL